jgi:hypothetical protein
MVDRIELTQREIDLIEACHDLARIIRDAEIPEGMVRRCLSFELAEFVYGGEEFWRNV